MSERDTQPSAGKHPLSWRAKYRTKIQIMNTSISRMFSSANVFFRQQGILLLFIFLAFQSIRAEDGISQSCIQQRSEQLFKVDTGGGILPLHNFTLSLTLKENTVYLKWVAENEMNTEKFVIQRSTDGTSFKNLGETPPAGPINTLTEYNKSDDVSGISLAVAYYRIRAEDNRGNFAYSNVVPVRLSKADGFSFWPMPFTSSLNLTYNAAVSSAIKLEVYDNSGRQVLQQQFSLNRGMNQLSVTGVAGLSHGLYHVRITDLMSNVVAFAKMAK